MPSSLNQIENKINWSTSLQNYFEQISTALFNELTQGEDLLVDFFAENTTYIRFNNSKVRQNTDLIQIFITLALHKDNKKANIETTVIGNLNIDLENLKSELHNLRAAFDFLPENPHFVPMKNSGTSNFTFADDEINNLQAISDIFEITSGKDFCGLFCCGSLVSGNKNSKGQSHWFCKNDFFIDYSVYNGERASKGIYSANTWDKHSFRKHFNSTYEKLLLLDKPKKKLSRGKYKVYLAPSAVSELLSTMNWGSFSAIFYKEGRSPLQFLVENQKSLSNKLSITENFKLGLNPSFNNLGEVSPEQIPLISEGKFSNFLVCSKSAKEYGLESNYAVTNESARSLEVKPGNLNTSEVLKKLDTGIYISDLHYINWSDRLTARLTGMTRYACLWVENGKFEAPIDDMRFDVSIYEFLGGNLVDLTSDPEIIPNTMTYTTRQFGGMRVPGILVNDFEFTL